MKRLLVGTAGHVDHGKTQLLYALTGVDTDRLPEEKRRGVTIDLGFAQMTLAELCIDFIDVPGHAHYIKNMLAGAGALDLVLMVVAADEGIMPQTQEHLQILSLLGTQRGVIVLTKCDLVEQPLRQLAIQEVREAFAGSFLETAPLVCVCTKSGEGLERLRELLRQSEPIQRPIKAPFRMLLDRVFVKTGQGVIATGVITEGSVCQGDTVCALPKGDMVRVRGLQSGGKPAQALFAGSRAAVNLAGVQVSALTRGMVLAQPESVVCTRRIDVRLSVLAGAQHPVLHNSRLHLAVGTASVVCRVALPKQGALLPGQKCFAQLRLEQPVAVRRYDRFVVRFYSPLETVGGGVILEPEPVQRRIGEREQERLLLYETGSVQEQLNFEATQHLLTRAQARKRFAYLSEMEFATAWEQLVQAGEYALPQEAVEQRRRALQAQLKSFHAAHPLAQGMPVASLYGRYPEPLLRIWIADGSIKKTGPFVSLADFSITETIVYAEYAARILQVYQEAGRLPLSSEQLSQKAGISQEQIMQMLPLLEAQGVLVCLGSAWILAEVFAAAKQEVRASIERDGDITLAQLRDMLGISRKYAQLLLETMDQQQFTKRLGDRHILWEKSD